MTADDDYKLLKVGIGFTNMVERATKGSADLTRKEIKEGNNNYTNSYLILLLVIPIVELWCSIFTITI